MSKVIIQGRYAEPIHVSKIIKGIMREVENPITHNITTIGDGQVIWDIREHRGCGHFLIAYQQNRGKGE